MPTILEALNLAQQALKSGDLAEAQFIYQQILNAAPDEPNALDGLGTLAYRAGQWEQAERYHRRAVEVVPDHPAFYCNLHFVYLRQGRLAEAVACCRRAVELAPDLPELHNNLGVVLKETGALEAARSSLEHAIQLRGDYADAHYNLGNTLSLLRQLEEAEGAYRRALALTPADPATNNNLGSLLQLQGDYSGAAACFETALGAEEHYVEAHRNRALLRLLLGDFARGWPEYEWRWRLSGVRKPDFMQPRWEGEPLSGRTILLWCEQGLGDAIQFIRYAPLVQQSGARVLLECPLRLHPLLETAPGIDRLVPSGAVGESFDVHLPLLSLPAVLGTTPETVPAAVPYLFAQPERVARWQREFAQVEPLKVGIAWQGNPAFPGDYYRSIPLACFAPQASCRGVKLFSLQKQHGCEQLASLADALKIVDLGATLDEACGAFLDTAAVMKNLDLVITSDTSLAHLAGALGVPVWVALPFSPNWRWQLARKESPWYPTMRLFRLARLAEWNEVFSEMAVELQSFSSRAEVK